MHRYGLIIEKIKAGRNGLQNKHEQTALVIPLPKISTPSHSVLLACQPNSQQHFSLTPNQHQPPIN